ncbi:MAG: hypothetical protein FWE23_09835 [Chitinivibrionia bacterium]|nr:hypothetical protein [Chitinivibrionia bacterium]
MKKILLSLAILTAFVIPVSAQLTNIRITNVRISPEIITAAGTEVTVTADISFNKIAWNAHGYWIVYLSKNPNSFNSPGAQSIIMTGGQVPVNSSAASLGRQIPGLNTEHTSYTGTQSVTFRVPDPLPQDWVNANEPWYVIVRVGGGTWESRENPSTWGTHHSASAGRELNIRTNVFFIENIAHSNTRQSNTAPLRIVTTPPIPTFDIEARNAVNDTLFRLANARNVFRRPQVGIRLNALNDDENVANIVWSIDGSAPTRPYNGIINLTNSDFRQNNDTITLRAQAVSPRPEEFASSQIREWIFVYDRPEGQEAELILLSSCGTQRPANNTQPFGLHQNIRIEFESQDGYTIRYNIGTQERNEAWFENASNGTPAPNSPVDNIFVAGANRFVGVLLINENGETSVQNWEFVPTTLMAPTVSPSGNPTIHRFIDPFNITITPPSINSNELLCGFRLYYTITTDGSIPIDPINPLSNEPNTQNQLTLNANGTFTLPIALADSSVLHTIKFQLWAEDRLPSEVQMHQYRQLVPYRLVLTPISSHVRGHEPIGYDGTSIEVRAGQALPVILADFSARIDELDITAIDIRGRIVDPLGNLVVDFRGLETNRNNPVNPNVFASLLLPTSEIPTTRILVEWNAQNQSGRRVGAGAYLAILDITGPSGVNQSFTITIPIGAAGR